MASSERKNDRQNGRAISEEKRGYKVIGRWVVVPGPADRSAVARIIRCRLCSFDAICKKGPASTTQQRATKKKKQFRITVRGCAFVGSCSAKLAVQRRRRRVLTAEPVPGVLWRHQLRFCVKGKCEPSPTQSNRHTHTHTHTHTQTNKQNRKERGTYQWLVELGK